MSPRRWISEEQVLTELERLNDLSMSLVDDFRNQAVQAAEAEAAHKALRAKRVLLAQTRGQEGEGRRMSVAQAETVAEADQDVAEAYRHRLITNALAEATREAMRTVRNNQDALRTAAASHRTPVA